VASTTIGDAASQRDLLKLWNRRSGTAPSSDAVYATLREAILSGILPPGTRLGEESLAARFEVSRTPVREAVLRLEAEHLAERVARRGLVVSTITPAEVLDLYVVRQAVDSHAAFLAAASASPPDVHRIRWINDRMKAAAEADDMAPMAKLNLEFHESICLAANSPMLLRFMRDVHDRVRRFPASTFAYPGRAEQAIREHEEIIEAIEAHDPKQAHNLAHDHMGRALEIRIRMFEGDENVGSSDLMPILASERMYRWDDSEVAAALTEN
jgi:DNA-binding GntR family transcriptional regulator